VETDLRAHDGAPRVPVLVNTGGPSGWDRGRLEAVHGVRSIGDILERTPSLRTNDLEAARRFFNRLWWYDQVVFDTSRQAA